MSLLQDIVVVVVLTIYFLSMAMIVLYSIGQFDLILTYWKHRRQRKPLPPLKGNVDLPFVTIQLPIYNEQYVAERLLDAMAALDYPKDSYEVQVLDDSNDETVEIIAHKVAALQAMGVQIEHVRRPDRVGFKAGALKYGLDFAKGNFIVIFDADFLPRPSYLRDLLPYFTDDRIGVVQARWEHINQHYSLFTEIQAFHLDAHFTIEQFSRDCGGYYMNFNGTAGIWRKECIIDAGGWEADTLTEDLDLSYRAQMRGWKFRYIDEIGAPAELPAEMGAIKSQQYRWMKGGAEVARKMLAKVWKSQAPLARKLHATVHLMSSSIFSVVLLLGASTVPLLYLKHTFLDNNVFFLVAPATALLISFFMLGTLYLTTFTHREGSPRKGLKRFLLHYVPFLSLSMGMSLHNTIAVVQGFLGKKTPFIRTPKFDILNKKDRWQQKRKYTSRKVSATVYGELLMALYFGVGVFLTFQYKDFQVLPFLLMQTFGFGIIGIFSLKHAKGW